MPSAIAETLAAALLVGTLLFAVARPSGWPEAVFAVPAAGILVAIGALPVGQAGSEARSLGPTIGFLAAVLVFADLCDRHGLFAAAGNWMAGAPKGRPVALLAVVFAVTSLVTAVLSLDATVLLLTPVVLTTVARLRLRMGPYAYACTHLANSASLLLPVSNLTNLLAFRASGLSFARFGAVMALPWVVSIATEWVVLRRFFATDLHGHGTPPAASGGPVPVFAAGVVVATLAGFFVASLAGVYPGFVALAGAVALAIPAVAGRKTTLRAMAMAMDVPFLAFVLALGLIVKALSLHGLGRVARHLVPGGGSLQSLLLTAALGALLANLINNLPAVLLLLPAAAASGPANVLALLVGVNAGPNLTYFGSLATLLWRRVLHQRGHQVAAWEFVRLGALSVPAVVLAGTVTLWISVRWVA